MRPLPVGSYVLAVSGGVDSVVLLDILAKQARSPELRVQSESNNSNSSQLSALRSQLTVAHFDHGMRPDSKLDRQLVQDLAHHHGLPFVYDQGNLGPKASEAAARQARYDFLHGVRRAAQARAVITAHHQDDVLETAVINLLRGTGRRGLTSLKSTDTIVRPLLHVPKQELIDYAQAHKLTWREDSTNQNTAYLRNRVRHQLLPRFTAEQRQQLLNLVKHLHTINNEIDARLINQLHVQPALDSVNRHWFIMLPHAVAREALAVWLRNNGIGDFDKKTLERLTNAAKTYHAGRRADINKRAFLSVSGEKLALGHTER